MGILFLFEFDMPTEVSKLKNMWESKASETTGRNRTSTDPFPRKKPLPPAPKGTSTNNVQSNTPTPSTPPLPPTPASPSIERAKVLSLSESRDGKDNKKDLCPSPRESRRDS